MKNMLKGVIDKFLDSIEANVDSAAVHVEDGNVQLQKASDYQVSDHWTAVLELPELSWSYVQVAWSVISCDLGAVRFHIL